MGSGLPKLLDPQHDSSPTGLAIRSSVPPRDVWSSARAAAFFGCFSTPIGFIGEMLEAARKSEYQPENT